ncbi:hypothetical protein ACFYZB_24655 [Streptomyces sp. NPDC001852]
MLHHTHAQVALMRPGSQVDALRELVTELLGTAGTCCGRAPAA